MVYFVLGCAGSGKTTHLHSEIERQAQAASGRIILFVPEQFTYETEKTLFNKLGAKLFSRVMVTSFTRFAGEVFKRYGGVSGSYVSDAARIVLMELTVETLASDLQFYRKSARSSSFPSTMLDAVSELKNAGISEEALSQTAERLPEGLLRDKTAELAVIYAAYNARLYTAYKDGLDDITRAAQQLSREDYFDDCHIFIDEFKGFTANEHDLLKLMFARAESVTVSLCLDTVRENASKMSAFASVGATYNRLLRLCREVDATVKPPIHLDAQHRFRVPVLEHMESQLFSPVVERFDGNCAPICATLCRNEYDEVDYVLATICRLVEREGYRYNDIAIIARDLSDYDRLLNIAVDKYNLPIFSDMRASVTTKPLIRFMKQALDCVQGGYRTDDVLALLKCGLTAPIEDIAALENYCFVWGIDRRRWLEPFEASPRGFTEKLTEEDVAELARINQLREATVTQLVKFEQTARCDNVTAKQLCVTMLDILQGFGIPERIESEIRAVAEQGELTAAQEQLRVWEILVEMIDTIALAAGDERLTLKQLIRIYATISATYDMGRLPQSLDCITVGAADRIRISDKRAVFIMGVNEDVFPQTPKSSGIFTDKEREQLIAMELLISPPIKEKLLEERFIAYKAMTSPSDRLYLTARKADVAGRPSAPSELLYQLERMGVTLGDSELLPGEYFCRSQATAFGWLARRYLEDTPLNAALKQVLHTDPAYAIKLARLEDIAGHRDHRLTAPVATALFGNELRLSPTRVEGYHQCAFKYFCEHGMRVRALRPAELDPLQTGTLIHDIIHTITRTNDLSQPIDMAGVKAQIKSELDTYLDTYMGGVKEKTSRFIYLYNRLRDSIYRVVERLHDELAQSAFTPVDYEYAISEYSDVKPLSLTAHDGTQIVVSGKVDRIDCYTAKDGRRYVRIIDYKSGRKQFSLDDVYDGLNLQMLIYLFCIEHNGQDKYNGIIPAGILYMPASEVEPDLPRNSTESDQNILKAKHYRMNGLILNDTEIVSAMDNSSAGIFIPVKQNADGTFSKSSMDSLASLSEFAKIDRHIKSLLVRMAENLHAGEIKAYPMDKTCDYCDYSSVCGRGDHTAIKPQCRFDRDEIIKRMEGDSSRDRQ